MKIPFIVVLVIISVHSKIACQEITMFPGLWGPKYYLNSDHISPQHVSKSMKEFEYTHRLWQKSKTQNTVAWIALGAQLCFSYYTLTNLDNRKRATNGLIGNLVCGAISIGYSLTSQNTKRKAILSYNKLIKEKKENSQFYTPSSSGLGIVMHF